MTVLGEWSLSLTSIKLWTFVIFFLPHPVEKVNDRVALVDARHSARSTHHTYWIDVLKISGCQDKITWKLGINNLKEILCFQCEFHAPIFSTMIEDIFLGAVLFNMALNHLCRVLDVTLKHPSAAFTIFHDSKFF